ncbi:MAG: hypothetical protein AAGF96_06040 [Bacteroidota bacterium]
MKAEEWSEESNEIVQSTGLGLILVMKAENIPNFIEATYEQGGDEYKLRFEKINKSKANI